MLDPNVFSRYKTKQDFDRESQEFEARKRQQALQEQLGQIQLQQAQAQMNQPSVPFQGTSFDAQIANEAYRFNLGKGMDEATARQRAVDMVLGSKTDYSQVTDPYTGQTSIVPRPRQGIFGQAQPQTQGQMPSMATPTFSPAPMPAAPSMQVRAVAPDMAAQMPAPVIPAQGVPLDPRAMQSPDVQKDLVKALGQADIELMQGQRRAVQEKQQAQPAAQKSFKSLIVDAENIFDRVDDAISMVNPYTAGLGSYTNIIAGTPGTNLNSALKTIQADAAFSRLQEMRDASKTGGALGQVTERELALLQNARIALDQEQSPKALRENLEEYKRIRLNALRNVAEAYKQDYGQYPEGFSQFIEKRAVPKRRLKYNSATGMLE